MRIVYALLLILVTTSSRPTKGKNEIKESDSSSPPTKKARIEKCHFSEQQTGTLETKPRPEKSKVSQNCGGILKSLETTFQYPLDPLTKESNATALLLCRGIGECNLDFSDQETIEKWKDVKICKNHAEELLEKWGDHHTHRAQHVFRSRNRMKKVEVCTWPDELCPMHKTRSHQRLRPLTIQEAQSVLAKWGILLHPGIPICRTHDNYLKEFITPVVDDSPKVTRYNLRHSSDDNTCAAEPIIDIPENSRNSGAADALRQFAEYVGVDRVCYPRKPFIELEDDTQRKKVCAVRKMFDVIFDVVAPTNPKELKEKVYSKLVNAEGWSTGSSKDLDNVLKQVAAQFFAAEDRPSKLIILGLVSNSVTLSKIHEYIPHLSSYLYTASRKFARRPRDVTINDKKLERYNAAALQTFITFITSPSVMTGLPFGTRKATLSDGTQQIIPDSIRLLSSTEVYNMYEQWLTDTDQKQFSLAKSTVFKILDVCAATTRKSTTCVDYFTATAMEAVDKILQIVDVWIKYLLLDKDEGKDLKTNVYEMSQYLRTDLHLHIKNHSRIADHCATYALSDPEDSTMSTSCDEGPDKHSHDLKCERCENMKATFMLLKSIAKSFILDMKELISNDSPDESDDLKKHLREREEELELLIKYEEQILELKKHVLRASYTDQVRQRIIQTLRENQALVTLDFAQKYLPTWHREKQSDYFAKKGISYHVAHVTARIGGQLVQHNFVHIYSQEAPQDSKVVVLTIQHIAAELKKMGIERISLRSDNAGCYHSASTIHSLHSIMEKTGITIDTYSFSEAHL